MKWPSVRSLTLYIRIYQNQYFLPFTILGNSTDIVFYLLLLDILLAFSEGSWVVGVVVDTAGGNAVAGTQIFAKRQDRQIKNTI